jgi:hypothetical protein
MFQERVGTFPGHATASDGIGASPAGRQVYGRGCPPAPARACLLPVLPAQRPCVPCLVPKPKCLHTLHT